MNVHQQYEPIDLSVEERGLIANRLREAGNKVLREAEALQSGEQRFDYERNGVILNHTVGSPKFFSTVAEFALEEVASCGEAIHKQLLPVNDVVTTRSIAIEALVDRAKYGDVGAARAILELGIDEPVA